MAKKPPCTPTCPKRFAKPDGTNCHSTCKDFVLWKAEDEADKAARKQVLTRENVSTAASKAARLNVYREQQKKQRGNK